MIMRRLALLGRGLIIVIAGSLPLGVFASDGFYDQTRKISLIDAQDTKYEIGEVVFFPTQEGGHRFQLEMEYEKFSDFFLSMKEMKCLEGVELWCHIPYPHPSPKLLSGGSLQWLEHELMFMFKDKQSFGANFWNGIYYKLRREGQQLTGEAYHVDLNELAAPPDDLTTPPLADYDFEKVERDKRWLPGIVIE